MEREKDRTELIALASFVVLVGLSFVKAVLRKDTEGDAPPEEVMQITEDADFEVVQPKQIQNKKKDIV